MPDIHAASTEMTEEELDRACEMVWLVDNCG
jgi:hypothetical protein